MPMFLVRLMMRPQRRIHRRLPRPPKLKARPCAPRCSRRHRRRDYRALTRVRSRFVRLAVSAMDVRGGIRSGMVSVVVVALRLGQPRRDTFKHLAAPAFLLQLVANTVEQARFSLLLGLEPCLFLFSTVSLCKP